MTTTTTTTSGVLSPTTALWLRSESRFASLIAAPPPPPPPDPPATLCLDRLRSMEGLRHQRSPGSDRFLGLFSPAPPDQPAGVELHESDVLWTSLDPAPSLPETAKPSPSTFLSRSSRGAPRGLRDRSFGILAALPEDDGGCVPAAAPPLLQRKPSISSSSNSPSSSTTTAARMIPAIPRAKSEYSLSVPVGKVHQPQSLPINVPVVPRRTTGLGVEGADGADDGGGDEHEMMMMMMPPHEIVARTHGRGSRMTTFSVLEGAGRTLKGRDLRRVRDAVLRQTGFVD